MQTIVLLCFTLDNFGFTFFLPGSKDGQGSINTKNFVLSHFCKAMGRKMKNVLEITMIPGFSTGVRWQEGISQNVSMPFLSDLSVTGRIFQYSFKNVKFLISLLDFQRRLGLRGGGPRKSENFRGRDKILPNFRGGDRPDRGIPRPRPQSQNPGYNSKIFQKRMC